MCRVRALIIYKIASHSHSVPYVVPGTYHPGYSDVTKPGPMTSHIKADSQTNVSLRHRHVRGEWSVRRNYVNNQRSNSIQESLPLIHPLLSSGVERHFQRNVNVVI